MSSEKQEWSNSINHNRFWVSCTCCAVDAQELTADGRKLFQHMQFKEFKWILMEIVDCTLFWTLYITSFKCDVKQRTKCASELWLVLKDRSATACILLCGNMCISTRLNGSWCFNCFFSREVLLRLEGLSFEVL